MSVRPTLHAADTLRKRDSAEIEHDLEHIRREIDSTLNALHDRLSPREVLHRVRARTTVALNHVGQAAKRNALPLIAAATMITAVLVISRLLRGKRS